MSAEFDEVGMDENDALADVAERRQRRVRIVLAVLLIAVSGGVGYVIAGGMNQQEEARTVAVVTPALEPVERKELDELRIQKLLLSSDDATAGVLKAQAELDKQSLLLAAAHNNVAYRMLEMRQPNLLLVDQHLRQAVVLVRTEKKKEYADTISRYRAALADSGIPTPPWLEIVK